MASDCRATVVKAKILVIGSAKVIRCHQSIKSICIRMWLRPHISSHLLFSISGGTKIYLQSDYQAIGAVHTPRLMAAFAIFQLEWPTGHAELSQPCAGCYLCVNGPLWVYGSSSLEGRPGNSFNIKATQRLGGSPLPWSWSWHAFKLMFQFSLTRRHSGWMGVLSLPANRATNKSMPFCAESSLEKMQLTINNLGKEGVKMNSFIEELH